MKPYLAQIRSDLKLMGRDRAVLFFSYLFPLTFFFIFAQLSKASQSSADMTQVIAMVIIIGVLGNGFFGAGMRTVQQRETNVLRRFKVTPAGPMPLIVASLVGGLVNFIPTVFLFFLLAKVLYGSPWPQNFGSLLLFVLIGVVSFRALGMIVAAVVNSAQEAQIIIQLLYLPMLFLSGATFPTEIMPETVRRIAHFLPATYLQDGIKSIAIEHASILANGTAVGALLITMALGVFVSVKLFRWEKEEKISGKSKLWILAVLAPFIILGAVETKTNQAIAKEKRVEREMARDRSILFNHVRIFVGDGKVIQNGAVLIRHGKIEQVFEQPVTDTKDLRADSWEESGRTLMPGLIDMHVHIGMPGGIYKDYSKYMDHGRTARNLAAYLYCGITAVRSTGDWLHDTLALRQRANSGEYLGAELFTYGPLFTAPGGHPMETLAYYPPQMQQMVQQELIRLPKSAAEAAQQVDALKAAGVDGIKAVLDSGIPGQKAFQRLDIALYQAVIAQATKDGLPSATHTRDLDDVREAVAAGTTTIEHGARTQPIPDELFAAMVKNGTAYDPTLTLFDVADSMSKGDFSVLDGSLLQRAAPADLIADTKATMKQHSRDGNSGSMSNWDLVAANLKRASEAGVALIAGSDAGNMLIIHGPTVQRELALWVKAGVPPDVALKAATYNAAKILRADNRIGLIARGHDATLLLVDGDPTQDISVLERISEVFLKGEQIQRWKLFDQDKK